MEKPCALGEGALTQGFDTRLGPSLLGTDHRPPEAAACPHPSGEMVSFSRAVQAPAPSPPAPHCLLLASQVTLGSSTTTLGLCFLICRAGGVALVSPDAVSGKGR